MSTDSTLTPSVFRTAFGMFVPCDRQTYRKLKRIRHLAGFAEVERRRWDRAQRRQPHNRWFKRRRASGNIVRAMADPTRMIFAPFYTPDAVSDPAAGYTPDARLAQPTDLFVRFFDDYAAARHPKPNASDVRPLHLPLAQIDALLEQIELWNLRR